MRLPPHALLGFCFYSMYDSVGVVSTSCTRQRNDVMISCSIYVLDPPMLTKCTRIVGAYPEVTAWAASKATMEGLVSCLARISPFRLLPQALPLKGCSRAKKATQT